MKLIANDPVEGHSKERMMSINRTAVYPHTLFARRIQAIAIGIGVICLDHLSPPLYGQSSAWGANPTWVTGANVGIGTTVPISLLDVRSANSVAPTVSIGLTSSSFPVQAVGSIAFGSLYPPNGAWYQAAGINGINEAAGDSSFGALAFLPRSLQTLGEKMRITSGSGKLRNFPSPVRSGADGSFSFGSLRAGPYRNCAQAPGTVWLNPCEWGLQIPAAALSAAQKSANLAVTMKKGVALPIRVDDPSQLLSNHEGKTPGAHLLIGVASDAQVFHHATLVSTDSTGRNYEIVIPFRAPVKLVVNGGFSLLGDMLGQALTRTSSTLISVIVPDGQQPSPIRLAVTGTAR